MSDEFFFWKYCFGHTDFLYSSRHFSGHHQNFFLISDFLSEILKGNKKLAKKDHSFYNIFSLKKLHLFYEPQLTWHWKQYASAMQSKTFLTLKIFQQTCFCLVLEKTFALHYFFTTKNCILEVLWKKMSLYFCIYL